MNNLSSLSAGRHLAGVLFLLGALTAGAGGINDNVARAEAIRREMWSGNEAGFQLTNAPDKWKDEEAVYLMRSLAYRYHKEAISGVLRYQAHRHIRIKIQSERALERFSTFTLRGSDSRFELVSHTYAGFRIIKPGGAFSEVPLVLAVKETETLNKRSADSYKLAIPNLAIGDVLDYYLAYEYEINTMSVNYYEFDPVVLPLAAEYPTVKLKINFDVLRRCFLNLKSLNGAPEPKLTDPEEDENRYFLEVNDLDGVPESTFLYPYLQLPAIKFKVVYASAMIASASPGFLGEPGKVKSSVSNGELLTYMSRVYASNRSTNVKSYMKKNFKSETDLSKLARLAYYAARNEYSVRHAEADLVTGRTANPERSFVRAALELSQYYKSQNIPHELFIGIPRHISSIDNLLLEEELTLMLKVNTNPPFYASRLSNHSLINEIDEDLQGTSVWSVDGLMQPGYWRLNKIAVPIDDATANKRQLDINVTFTDLKEGKAEVDYAFSARGTSRSELQDLVMDFYDYKAEEQKRFPFIGIEALKPKQQQEAAKLVQEYLKSKPAKSYERLRKSLEEDFAITVDSLHPPVITQTGRFDEAPDFKFSLKSKISGLTRPAGQNYLFEIGKLIEKQFVASESKSIRNFDAYLAPPHQVSYTITVKLPEGYTVRGIEGLSAAADNEIGSVVMNARQKDNALVVTFVKTYKENFADKAAWAQLDSFLETAKLLNGKQVLLESVGR